MNVYKYTKRQSSFQWNISSIYWFMTNFALVNMWPHTHKIQKVTSLFFFFLFSYQEI